MIRPFLAVLPAFLLAGAPLLAQEQPAAAPSAPADSPPAVSDAVPTLPRVRLETGEGPILIELEIVRAPKTAANFLRYIDQKRLDGTSFYRALKLNDAGLGLVQGGIKSDPKRALAPVVHEPTSATGLSHVEGAVSLARAAPGTGTADFFILTGAIPSLDSGPTDPAGFAVFGRVVDGMDAVRRILAAPVSATAGEGVMRGQMIAAPVPIRTARRAR